jgi:hypothetical protein
MPLLSQRLAGLLDYFDSSSMVAESSAPARTPTSRTCRASWPVCAAPPHDETCGPPRREGWPQAGRGASLRREAPLILYGGERTGVPFLRPLVSGAARRREGRPPPPSGGEERFQPVVARAARCGNPCGKSVSRNVGALPEAVWIATGLALAMTSHSVLARACATRVKGQRIVILAGAKRPVMDCLLSSVF